MPLRKTGQLFAQRPWIISLILIVIICVWLFAGIFPFQSSSDSSTDSSDKQVTATERHVPLAKVVVTQFEAQPVARKIDLYGRTAPNRDIELSAELDGSINGIKVRKGDVVKRGQVIATIDKGDLDILLDRANALLRVKQKEFNAATSLRKRGLQNEVEFTKAEAELVNAKATVANVKLGLRYSVIRAPFSGVIDRLYVELGDYVARGDKVAHLIDLNTLVIEADLSERHIQGVQKGQTANITLLGGEQIQGTLRYISRNSSLTTNTFPIEIEIANKDQRLPSGVSAEVELELDTQMAVMVTPAMLALDESGNLGVKTLQDDHIHFVGIQIVKAEKEGVWLSGLGERVDIVTKGQGFVRDGDPVIAVRQ
ncbi:efflux transporter periplasmic adaptor subunit [Vibrio sp. UCD-FRSSP16_10]|uniref:efflux RND transporter periplasmic adaptor subunit n=1 Tax=unclassified Vibrio TaxID=2614977 RepID=UPI0007FF9574|nr:MULTISPECIES: efflux RND transporter periplasmic adaptor subunit [unclassified Vibrio]OBT17261.1 efflux transporter periplasmic adaptor subunit [Vibrio sp. UCD-FRSSP16_30]OBT23030.1 efflux transporter periplasmic adaptor subunit [Vibrio sp. UCD-FRSSP16_10]